VKYTAIADAHVDVLWRMEHEGASFYGDSHLQASAQNLRHARVMTQVFALFVEPDLPSLSQLNKVLRSIDIFRGGVVKPGFLRAVASSRDLSSAQKNDEIAGILSLEGAACLQGDPGILRILFELGVRGAGLTWNYANDLADGCLEVRKAGLTAKGVAIIKEMSRLGMWTDLSHLADEGVYDVFRHTEGPVMASHANAREVHQHPRNLTDDVIRHIIARDGWIGLVFESSFVASERTATVRQLLRHLDHMLALGAENNIGFGSDFDGTSNPLTDLSNAFTYRSFGEQLVERYGLELAEKLLHGNLERFLMNALPSS
jgi:membrane dipeptidase